MVNSRSMNFCDQEKNILKQKIYNELLPKAFGKITRNYAFIDTKNNWLILNTNNAKRVENFASFLTRSLNAKIVLPEIKKISPILTDWLLNHKYPSTLNIEDACVLQDPRQQQRSVRIRRQELSANYVQTLLKNNFEVSQIKMTWSDQITFMLKNDFSLQSLQYKDSEIELSSEDKIDTKEGSFRANFFIMSGILSKMFSEFLKIFKKSTDPN